jgi:hypothetical protein
MNLRTVTEALLTVVKKDKVSDKDVHQAKIAIETIAAMQPIYERFKQNSPEIKFDPTDDISLNIAEAQTGGTPLTWACSQGHTAIAQSLLEHKADPNQANAKTGDTPLMWAAYKGDRALTRTLIEEYKAKLEIRNNKGNTALDEAVEGKKLETISLLLKQGALVQNPQKLFDFLTKEKRRNSDELLCDQRDNDVLVALDCLFKQLNALVANGCEDNIKNLHNEVKIYLEKLRKLNEIHQKKLVDEVDAATGKIITSVLLDMVAAFDAPLEDPRVRFFKPAEIDSLLPKLEENKKATSSSSEGNKIEKNQNRSNSKANEDTSKGCSIM